MPPSLRPAIAADAPALAAVHVEGWRWGYRGLLPAALLDAISVADREALWRKALGPGGTTAAVVAEHAGAVVAFAAWGPPLGPAEDGAAELYALYQREACAGTGLGRALLAAATEGMRQAGHRQALLWVLRENARAQAFYARHGWDPDGATGLEVRDGVTLVDIRYSLDLTAR